MRRPSVGSRSSSRWQCVLPSYARIFVGAAYQVAGSRQPGQQLAAAAVAGVLVDRQQQLAAGGGGIALGEEPLGAAGAHAAAAMRRGGGDGALHLGEGERGLAVEPAPLGEGRERPVRVQRLVG